MWVNYLFSILATLRLPEARATSTGVLFDVFSIVAAA